MVLVFVLVAGSLTLGFGPATMILLTFFLMVFDGCYGRKPHPTKQHSEQEERNEWKMVSSGYSVLLPPSGIRRAMVLPRDWMGDHTTLLQCSDR